ncbi:hypothetical protein I7I50_00450 [Histoplasma capsulatum G186AR]|uniref:Uncharacterized protein n=1 Tax=Ajellomyces capsulatus TaxID=5037 RepID=A0A8H7YJF5_AJECA|nr:hypothetical protein I7I52_07718 [Histoplasma capsulatum]QSS72567.1 hypothetical protein I7I50_00450 [Histoplasma capsulatum G186AR]
MYIASGYIWEPRSYFGPSRSPRTVGRKPKTYYYVGTKQGFPIGQDWPGLGTKKSRIELHGIDGVRSKNEKDWMYMPW